MSKVKILLLRRWYMVGGAALLAAAAIFYAVNYPASVSAAATTRQLPIYSVERSQKVCAISFDAAWGDGKVRQSRGQTVFVQLGGAVGIQAGYVAGGDGAAELCSRVLIWVEHFCSTSEAPSPMATRDT